MCGSMSDRVHAAGVGRSGHTVARCGYVFIGGEVFDPVLIGESEEGLERLVWAKQRFNDLHERVVAIEEVLSESVVAMRRCGFVSEERGEEAQLAEIDAGDDSCDTSVTSCVPARRVCSRGSWSLWGNARTSCLSSSTWIFTRTTATRAFGRDGLRNLVASGSGDNTR